MSSENFTQEAAVASSTARSERFYQRVFNVDPDETVLDLGSGFSRFPRLPNVIKVDYAYRNTTSAELGSPAVAALYQHLPFASEAVDRTTMSYGARWMSPQGATQMLDESFRVLKFRGSTEIFPVKSTFMLRRALRELEAFGCDIEHATPTFMKRFGIVQTAASVAIGGSALYLHQRGFEFGGVVGGMVAAINGMVANFRMRAGKLTIRKNEVLEDPARRRAVAKYLAPHVRTQHNVSL